MLDIDLHKINPCSLTDQQILKLVYGWMEAAGEWRSLYLGSELSLDEYLVALNDPTYAAWAVIVEHQIVSLFICSELAPHIFQIDVTSDRKPPALELTFAMRWLSDQLFESAGAEICCTLVPSFHRAEIKALRQLGMQESGRTVEHGEFRGRSVTWKEFWKTREMWMEECERAQALIECFYPLEQASSANASASLF